MNSSARSGSTITRTRTRGSAKWLVLRVLVCFSTRLPAWWSSEWPPAPTPVGGIMVRRVDLPAVRREARLVAGVPAAARPAVGVAAADPADIPAATAPVADLLEAGAAAAARVVVACSTTIAAAMALPAVGAAAAVRVVTITAAQAAVLRAEPCITLRWKAASPL